LKTSSTALRRALVIVFSEGAIFLVGTSSSIDELVLWLMIQREAEGNRVA
jgi:hypothetical protein